MPETSAELREVLTRTIGSGYANQEFVEQLFPYVKGEKQITTNFV